MDSKQDATSLHIETDDPFTFGHLSSDFVETMTYTLDMTNLHAATGGDSGATANIEPYTLGFQCHVCGWDYMFNGHCERCGN